MQYMELTWLEQQVCYRTLLKCIGLNTAYITGSLLRPCVQIHWLHLHVREYLEQIQHSTVYITEWTSLNVQKALCTWRLPSPHRAIHINTWPHPLKCPHNLIKTTPTHLGRGGRGWEREWLDRRIVGKWSHWSVWSKRLPSLAQTFVWCYAACSEGHCMARERGEWQVNKCDGGGAWLWERWSGGGGEEGEFEEGEKRAKENWGVLDMNLAVRLNKGTITGREIVSSYM